MSGLEKIKGWARLAAPGRICAFRNNPAMGTNLNAPGSTAYMVKLPVKLCLKNMAQPDTSKNNTPTPHNIRLRRHTHILFTHHFHQSSRAGRRGKLRLGAVAIDYVRSARGFPIGGG